MDSPPNIWIFSIHCVCLLFSPKFKMAVINHRQNLKNHRLSILIPRLTRWRCLVPRKNNNLRPSFVIFINYFRQKCGKKGKGLSNALGYIMTSIKNTMNVKDKEKYLEEFDFLFCAGRLVNHSLEKYSKITNAGPVSWKPII